MLEGLAMYSDSLMEKLLAEQQPSQDEIHAVVKAAVQNQSITPVFCGSAYKTKGVQKLLDAVVRYLPRVPATAALPDALSRLRQDNSHLALVTDAGGTVCAIVTLEDLVEDLVGTVRDGTHRG
jgi:CBS domain containing-hemolysin-like protein